VDEFGRPLYGDVFGTAEPSGASETLAEGLRREPWGAMEEEEEEDDDDDDDDDDDGVALEDGSVTDDDINAGISSVTSTAASGLATPDALNLRKTIADGVGTPSAVSTGGLDTPESLGGNPQLYQVLEQTSSKVGGSAFGSSHGYVVPPPPSGGIGSQGGTNKEKRGRGVTGGGVDLALDPAELENLDEGALKARYDQLRKAESDANAPEDVSDIIAEQERKRKRKQDAGKR